MKKLYYLIVIVLISGLVLTGCLLSNVGQVPPSEQSGIAYLTKGTPVSFTLYAGQHIDVGTVSVWNDGVDLYVTYNTTSPWVMTETHLAVADSLAGIPHTKTGNPKPGKFPYFEEHDPAVTTYTYNVPLADLDAELYIAAQAEVFRSSEGNILNNPDAETGDMSGWNFIGPVRAIEFRHESTGDVFPRSGDYFFDMTASPAEYAEMSQELSVAGYDGVSFIANCWIQTELYPDPDNTNITDNDYGELVLTFKDGFDAVLGTFTTGPIGNPVPGAGTTGYAPFDLTGNIPPGAVTVIYMLKGFLLGGTYVNVFYDELLFEYWQEETAWADGTRFTEQGNWAMYFNYTVQEGSAMGTFIRYRSETTVWESIFYKNGNGIIHQLSSVPVVTHTIFMPLSIFTVHPGPPYWSNFWEYVPGNYEELDNDEGQLSDFLNEPPEYYWVMQE